MLHHARLATLLLAPVLLVAACSADSPDAADPVPTAQVAATADCLAPQVLDDLALAPDVDAKAVVPPSSTAHGEAPPRGRAPDSFTAAGVLVCAPGGTMVDGQGAWSSVVATRRDGDVSDLRKALELPDARPSESAACGEPQRIDLWLTDALGRGVRVTIPGGACAGDARQEVLDAIDALHVTDVATYQVELLEPSPTPSG